MPEGLAFGVLDGLRGVEVRILSVRFASLPCNICNVFVVTFGVSIAVVGVPEAYRRAELAVRGCGRLFVWSEDLFVRRRLRSDFSRFDPASPGDGPTLATLVRPRRRL